MRFERSAEKRASFNTPNMTHVLYRLTIIIKSWKEGNSGPIFEAVAPALDGDGVQDSTLRGERAILSSGRKSSCVLKVRWFGIHVQYQMGKICEKGRERVTDLPFRLVWLAGLLAERVRVGACSIGIAQPNPTAQKTIINVRDQHIRYY